MSTGSEKIETAVNALRKWQGIERHAITDTARISEETDNPLIRLIMDIIRHDSLMHHRVQQFLIDALTVREVALTREDVAKVWEKIEAHDKTEREAIDIAETLKKNAWSPVHKQLLDYLLNDEKKHDQLLVQLDEIKKGMNRASGG